MNDVLAPVLVHAPPNDIERIDQVWLYVSADERGEGICSALCAAPLGPAPVLAPLMAADPKRLEHLDPVAQELANLTGRNIRLIKLCVREEVATIRPARTLADRPPT